MKQTATHQSNPAYRFLVKPFWNLFSSIKLGITLIVLIFCYAALGSAVPGFRQIFELTEFQYFKHPIFAALILLFCVTLIVTTIRRIRFNRINAGVLTVHFGLLMLCGSAMWYFGTKTEGDVLLRPATIQIISNARLQKDPTKAVIGTLVAARGRVWEQNMPMLGGLHRIEVVGVDNLDMQTARAVTLAVTAPNGSKSDVTLNSDQPRGAIAKLTPALIGMLKTVEPGDEFFDDTTPSLTIVYGENDPQRREFPLPQLPYYKERLAAVEGADDPGTRPVLDLNGDVVRSKRVVPIPIIEQWEMPIPVLRQQDTLAKDLGFTVEIDGYLPYAEMDNAPIDGGPEESPIIHIEFGPNDHLHDAWLWNDYPRDSQYESESGARVEFNWIGDDTELDHDWTRRIEGTHVLEVELPSKGIQQSFDVKEGQQIALDGTDYSLTVEQLRPSWPLMTAGFENAKTPIALIWVERPDGAFQRSVLQRFPELNQDRDRKGAKIKGDGGLVDTDLVLRYTNAATDHFRIVAGANFAPTVIHTAPGGARSIRQIAFNDPVRFDDGATLIVTDLIRRPQLDSRPVVIPEINRRSLMDVKRQQSMVRVHLRAIDGAWSRRKWVPFSQYNLEYRDLFGGSETVVGDLPTGRAVGLVYGRHKLPLPAPMVLEQLVTKYYPGGQQPREWTSIFRYQDPPTGGVKTGRAFLNNTYTIGDWTFFQSGAAADGSLWTILGVGNRNGVWAMLAACTLIALGMIYAFSVKPVLVRRRKERLMSNAAERPARGGASRARKSRAAPAAVVVKLLPPLFALIACATVRADTASLKAIEGDIDVEKLGAIAMLDNNAWRYSTVESWARRTMRTLHGSESLDGLDPVVSALEIMFNSDAYTDEPIIYVKDLGILKDLTKHPIHVSDAQAKRMFHDKRVSPAFLARPDVKARIQELANETLKSRAMNRMFGAQFNYQNIAQLFTIIPVPSGTKETPWLPPVGLLNANVRTNAGISVDDAKTVLKPFSDLADAWRARDARAINAAADRLDQVLPTLAPEGLYPSPEMRYAEQRYRRLDLTWFAWLFYIGAFFVCIFALATGYRWAIGLGTAVLICAVGLHGYDIWLRWGVLGRIPNANMYEAVTFSAWCGAMFGLLLGVLWRKRVLILASATVGFLALALPEFIPDKVNNDLLTMMPILDDTMLRIHTTLIITSYQVITLAYAVANCFLVVAAVKDRSTVARVTIGAQLGAALCVLLGVKGYLAALPGIECVGIAALLVIAGGFVGMGGFRLAAGSAQGAADRAFDAEAFPVERSRSILNEFDLCQRVLIYTATVALFVGTILGAIWADYSWGRPWGWDPKEVFAMNTWLIYAILIHVRFVTKNRALWTSVLSVIGFAVMLFNWFVVNFYIVGLHSYA